MNWDWFKRLVHSFERAANNEAIAPDQRFSALDGLLFADIKNDEDDFNPVSGRHKAESGVDRRPVNLRACA
jgi:hypothetical protein